jgi:hypothetical protein
MEGARINVVPEEHGRPLSPPPVNRFHAPAQRGIIEDVVVNQSGRMDEFDHAPDLDVVAADLATGEPRREEEQGRPDLLSVEPRDVVEEIGDERLSRAELRLEEPPHGAQGLLDRAVEGLEIEGRLGIHQ